MSGYRETGFVDPALLHRRTWLDAQKEASEAAHRASPDHVSWRRILLAGVALYLMGLVAYGLTSSLTLLPSLLLLGSFLVPVTYVAFFYQHRHLSVVSLPTVAQAFVYGGFLGAFGDRPGGGLRPRPA